MAGTIYSGSYMGGIVLDDPATQLPATVTGSVSNKDGDAILGTAAARWTVANQGTIQSTGSAGYGIDLRAGGMVANGPSGASAALISGAGGVLVRGKRGAVNNFATITGTDAKRDGVELEAGGRVTNGNAAVTAASISGGRHAVTIRAAAGTVTNFGTLANFGTLGVADLFAGGAVTNGSSTSTKALISGAGRGVYLLGGIGTVTNFGTIEALRGVVLSDGGTVTNFGTIETRTGVILSDGGEVTNGSAVATGALISATVNGVVIGGVAGTVTNFGTIQAGVVLETVGIGRITNGSAAATIALIGGILIANGTQTVSNFGTISSFFGVVFEGGSRGRVANGSAASTDALISGQIRGVSSYDLRGTVSNFGTISSGFFGVYLKAGRVTNGGVAATDALISGANEGVFIGSGAVSNFGTIDGGVLFQGGMVTNGSAASTSALISGANAGVSAIGGTVTNFGTISGGVVGVELDNAAGLTNFGTISGGKSGVYFDRTGVTVTNFGTISGGSSGAAVQSAAGVMGQVVVEPGAVFVGSVLGGGASEIDFVAGGAADLGNVSGFATIGLSNGRHHTLTLTGTNFAAVVGAAITIDDGNAGNTVTAATLPATDSIIVHAGAGLDKLTGGEGNDVFYAGGDTVMTGKAGTNEFVFSAPGDNTIGDFGGSTTNEIVFSNNGFSLGLSFASGTQKALPADLFVKNSDGHFTDTTQRFAYATGTDDLFYSASGSDGTPTPVSHLTKDPVLAASQLFFIA